MLDVHPPHEAAHTWKDFFIHIATISVGLLIAVGLEQSVEAVHHAHQRHALEAQLQAEAQRNLDLTQGNLDKLMLQLHYFEAAIVALNQAPVMGGSVTVTGMPQSGTIFDIDVFDPSQTAWTVATANGTVALLPEDEAQVYARLEHEGDLLNAGANDARRTYEDLITLVHSSKGLTRAQQTHMSLQARDTLIHTIATNFTQVQQMLFLELDEAGACRGVLNGAKSVNAMLDAIVHEFQQYVARYPREMKVAPEPTQ
jgi:hypothetical protein